jgi:cytoskeletal protein CcmA (bactofilin family)
LTAAPALAAETANSEFVIIRSEDVLEDDLYAGAIKVTVEGTIDGDLIAFAAEEIVINGVVTGSVLAVAPRVMVNGTVEGALRVSGGSLWVNGTVSRDVVVTALEVQLGEESSVERDVLAWTIDMTALGHIGRRLEGTQGSLSLAGEIDGDVDVSVGRLVVVDDLVVSGDLGYRSSRDAEGLDMADVGGAVVHKAPLPPNIRVRALGLFGRALAVIFLTIAALGVAYGWPVRTGRAVARIRKAPVRSWAAGALIVLLPLVLTGIGALIVGLAPASASFPLLVIMVPLVLASTGLVLALALVAGVPAAGWLGSAVFRRLQLNGAVLAGSLILGGLWLVPLVGWLVPLLALPLGMGAWMLSWNEFETGPE